MRKLFYLAVASIVLFYACTSTEKKENKELDEMNVNVIQGGTQTIQFVAEDSLTITADFYPNDNAERIIILCHQAGFSRAEYKDIAPRLVDSGYACLAIDQRSGREVFGVVNETHRLAIEKGLPTGYLDARKDIEAAIDYVSEHSSKEIYLWGSSYSGSLALMIGAQDKRVKRIVAFSPGEYFNNQSVVKNAIVDLTTPVYITGSQVEAEMVVEPLVKVLPRHNVVYHKPDYPGDHGSKTLWSPNAEKAYEALFEFL